MRKHKYLADYGDEFTIRSGRPSGKKTELAKIIEGWGNYFFYGFSDGYEKRLKKWFIGDLNAFRLYFSRYMSIHNGEMPGIENINRDGSSIFRAFKHENIPNFIVRSSDEDSYKL